VLIAWRTRNLLLTIILGMLALWVWQAILASHLLG
jgi:branched-subunit amino acid transport protein